MFRRRWFWITAVILITTVATVLCWWCWAPWSIPSHPDQLTLYSIDGGSYEKGEEPKADEKIYNYPLLGKIEVTDPELRHKIMSALRQGVQENTGNGFTCFWPRHIIRIVTGGRTIDYLICFECRHIYIKEDGKLRILHTTDSPLPLFNKTLQDAGVKLAPFQLDRIEKEHEE